MLNDKNRVLDGSTAEMGGYFELDLPWYPEIYPESLKYQSGRAAIRTVLEHAGVVRVMVPAYVCDSVIKAVVDSGAVVETYDLDHTLYPKGLPNPLPDRCVVLYVNYFGLCGKNMRRLFDEFPHDRLIIDNSQALFAPHQDVLATVYSPRKFTGVPDGGLLMVSHLLNIALPLEEDRASIERMRSLLVRMAYSAREGYADFQQIAQSLKDTNPLRMSRLTQRIMRSISWGRVAERRRENYLAIAQKLDALNGMRWELGAQDVPMCYPLTLSGGADRIRDDLARRNIFVPVYWQDALPRIKRGSIEETLIHQTLFLPIDQRMETLDAERLGDLVLASVS